MPLYRVRYAVNGVVDEVLLKLPIDDKKIAEQHLINGYNVRNPIVLAIKQEIDMSAYEGVNAILGDDDKFEDLPKEMQQYFTDKFVKDNRPSFLDYIGIGIDKIIIGFIVIIIVLYIFVF